MLGGGSSPLPLPAGGGSSVGGSGSGGFGGLHQHERMVGPVGWPWPGRARWVGSAPSDPSYPVPCTQGYQLHGAEVNGGLPAVSTFSSAPTGAYSSVSSHTPPVSGADSLLGTAPSPHTSGGLRIQPWVSSLTASPLPGSGSSGPLRRFKVVPR